MIKFSIVADLAAIEAMTLAAGRRRARLLERDDGDVAARQLFHLTAVVRFIIYWRWMILIDGRFSDDARQRYLPIEANSVKDTDRINYMGRE